jgi:hypothetical protein
LHAATKIRVSEVLSVPRETNIAQAIHDDQAAAALRFRAKEGDCGLASGARIGTVGNEVGGPFGDEQAYKIFSLARTGDGGIIIGVKAATWEGRVADPTGILVGNAARRGSGGEKSCAIKCDGADGAVFLRRLLVVLSGPGALPVSLLALGKQVFVCAERYTLLDRELLRAATTQEDVRAIKYFAGQNDRVFDQLNGGNSSYAQCMPLHETGVHLDVPFGAEAGACPGIELGVVFEIANRCFYRIERASIVF